MKTSPTKIMLYPICMVSLLLLLFLLFSYVYSLRKPSIYFQDGQYFDFGIIDEGESAAHAFNFVNRGGEPLTIKKTKASCACTKAECNKTVIEGGESGRIDVLYKSRPQRNRETMKIWLETNDPKQPFVELTLTGRVRLRVFWYPQSVSFRCKQGTSHAKREIHFLSDNTEPFDLKQIRTSSERITVSSERQAKNVVCKIYLSPACPRGNWTERIDIQIRIGNYERNIEIPVYLMIM